MARRHLVIRTRRAVRTWLTSVGKRVPFVLDATRGAVASVRGRQYRAMCRRYPVERSACIFESFGSRAYSCSPRALYEAMLADERCKGFTFTWSFRAPVARALQQRGGYDVRGLEDVGGSKAYDGDLDVLFGSRALEDLKRSVIVPWGSHEYRRSYAKAAYWISNSIVPVYLKPREGQVYVQTWHGTPLKTLGCDIPLSTSGSALYSPMEMHTRYKQEGARLTYLLSPSRFATEKLATAFDLVSTGRTSVIVEEGYPRNDRLHTATAGDVAAIRHRLGLPGDKRIIVYAPTWRDDQHASGVGYTYTTEVDFDALKRELGEEYVILFRAHCLVANRFEFERYEGFVRDVSRVGDINDLYLVSDMLVTDYSSVFFDYANLRRPIVFYMYDLQHYAEELHGFYLDLEELPGPIARTGAELIEAIRSADSTDAGATPRYQRFHDRFNHLDDGRASQRVLERVLRAPAGTGAP